MTTSALRVSRAIPIVCEKQALDPHALASLRQNAQLLIHALNLMDTSPLHETEPEQAHLQRLDAKIDLMLHLLAQSLQGNHPLPQAMPVELGPEIVSWQELGAQPTVGDTIVLGLYLSPGLPLPLKLPAHITASADGRVTAQLADLGEDLDESWRQWVFRQHRRDIHAQRPAG